jgi:hypothetical protein
MRFASWCVALAAVIGSTYALEKDASACGGCFGESTTVVTDHRMILSIAKDRSTLYDQIKYSGDPAAFAWVLPISGTVEVGLSADVVFQTLDQVTTTRVLPPPRNCAAPSQSCPPVALEAGVYAPTGSGDVTVTKREVVGPYETVQLKSTDANALETWLTTNGFVVPADVKPIIAQYVAEKFDFLALKLVPNKGVKDMRPVRVTTQGANTVLPLRMVAAGTGAVVGITLWIVGEGRYEPQNFPSFIIGADELAWSWTENKSNFTTLRAQKTAAAGGRAWELESATTQDAQNLASIVNGNSTDASYDPVLDPQGAIVKTAAQVRAEDLAALFRAGPPRVTRLRADLAHAALADDLVVIASQDQAELPTLRQAKAESDEPLCPIYEGCTQVGSAPRSQAIAQSKPDAAGASSASSSSCAIGSSGAAPAWLVGVLAFAAFSITRSLRRRRG